METVLGFVFFLYVYFVPVLDYEARVAWYCCCLFILYALLLEYDSTWYCFRC
jgi:hypothetical protein